MESKPSSSLCALYERGEVTVHVDEGQRSQYSDEFRAKQNDIGALMQSKSTGLLNDLLTKAMTTALQSVAQ